MRKSNKALMLDDLELEEEYIPKKFKTKTIKNRKRKLNKQQWLMLHEEEANLKIEDIEQNGCNFKEQ